MYRLLGDFRLRDGRIDVDTGVFSDQLRTSYDHSRCGEVECCAHWFLGVCEFVEFGYGL